MIKNYVQLVGEFYPGTIVSCSGDSSVYSNLSWDSSPIPEAELDGIFLSEAKKGRLSEVDTKTVQLISGGFTFDGNQFSLSQAAQINWVGLKSLKSLMAWPVNITTLNDGEYALAQANLDSFIGTGKFVVQSHLDSGRALKSQILATTTIAELDAVEDNR